MIPALDEVKAQLKERRSMKHPLYLIVGVLFADHIGYAEKSSTEKINEFGVKPSSQLASLAVGFPTPLRDVVDLDLANSAAHL